MDRIRIRGGNRLNGTIPISGAKNAALPLMIVSLLTPGTLTLEVDREAGWLFLHTLYAEPSPEALRLQLRRDYELPLRRLL